MEEKTTEDFPYVPPDLVNALEGIFPNEVPNKDDSDREIWIKVGTRRVIERLKVEMKRQENEYYGGR